MELEDIQVKSNSWSTSVKGSDPAHKLGDGEAGDYFAHILLLIRLIIVLVWIAFMYDRLLMNPFLAAMLVLGVLAILFGGTLHLGPVKVQKELVEDRAQTPPAQPSATTK